MKKIIALVLLMTMVFVFVGCEPQTVVVSAEEKQRELTQQSLNQMNNEIGMPNIKEFYEKKMAKEIFELRDNSKLITYVYTQSVNGKFVYVGKAMGFGLPYSTQYTNPQQVKEYYGGANVGYGNVSIPQADPNGLYMPESAAATWLMMINEETGKREVMYCEPNTVVTQSKIPRRLVESWSLTENY